MARARASRWADQKYTPEQKIAYVKAAYATRKGEPYLWRNLAEEMECCDWTVLRIARDLGIKLGEGSPHVRPVNEPLEFTPEQTSALIEAYMNEPHLSLKALGDEGTERGWPPCSPKVITRIVRQAIAIGARTKDGRPVKIRSQMKLVRKTNASFTLPQLRRLAEAYVQEPEKSLKQLAAEGDGKWWPKCSARTVIRIVRKAIEMGITVDGEPIKLRESGKHRPVRKGLKYDDDTFRACLVDYHNPVLTYRQIAERNGIESYNYVKNMIIRARKNKLVDYIPRRKPQEMTEADTP